MIAGLLGEHLASPRTATKTNQNTALDQHSQRDRNPTNEDGFASYVTKDSDAASAETLRAQNKDARSQPTPETAEDALAAAVIITDPSTSQSLDGETTISVAASPSAEGEGAEPILTSAAEADVISSESPAIDPRLLGGTAAETAASEIVAEDPRSRAPASQQEIETVTATEPRSVKLAQDAIPSANESGADPSERTARPTSDAAIVMPTDADLVEADQARTARADDAINAQLVHSDDSQIRSAISETTGLERSASTLVSRDAATLGAEPTLTIAPAPAGSTPAQVSTGLTPTAPSILVAAPSDLTSVILNALKNGADPQEQLVVQLDPPELGRVMIDFKFDAQGVQQITVTSENPEALKRLREMHFELTQALRDNGLSGQNMSFRQEAEGRPHNAWQDQDQQRPNAHLIAAEDRRASPSAVPAQPNVQARDRLDLLL